MQIIPPNPTGLCMCGCGQTTPLAPQSDTRRGYVRGEHIRFVYNHHARGSRRVKVPTEERFWKHVDKSSGPLACWPWTASRNWAGYGRFQKDGVTLASHRVAWELTNGPIPAGACIRHKVCDNPCCCNPAHLLPGTYLENNHDMIDKGRAKPPTGERHSSRTHPERVARGQDVKGARLTAELVRAIRAEYAHGASLPELVAQFGTTRGNMFCIVHRQTWKHID